MKHRNLRIKAAQQGVVLIFALIALVVMLIGAVAISRSLNSAQFVAGNIGFKRDLTNQSERVIQAVLAQLTAGGALYGAALNGNVNAWNYSATLLSTNPQGIPLALLSDSAFTSVGSATHDITVEDLGVTLRYVIERFSSAVGPCTSSTCVTATPGNFAGSSNEWTNASQDSAVAPSAASSAPKVGAVPPQPIFRVTVRAKGPRGTLAFYQSTFTSP